MAGQKRLSRQGLTRQSNRAYMTKRVSARDVPALFCVAFFKSVEAAEGPHVAALIVVEAALVNPKARIADIAGVAF